MSDPTRVLWQSRVVALLALIAAIVPSAIVFVSLELTPVVVIPVIVAAIPFAGMTQRQFHALSFGAGLLMLVWVFLGGFSIGFLYVPCMVLLLNASLIARYPQPWIRSLKLSALGFLGGAALSLAYAAGEVLSSAVELARPSDFLANVPLVFFSGVYGAFIVFITTFAPAKPQPS